jgi:hypothetical protein
MEFEEEILIDLANMAMQIMVERRDKMREHFIRINQDTAHYGKSYFGSLENLLGPPVTHMPKLLHSLNTLVGPLPKKVPILIELDPKVPVEIECNDVLLLRSVLSLLSHSAGRTENGSIHLQIRLKKKRIVFECSDTGSLISSKPKHVKQYFDSLTKSSGMAAMLAMVRSMKGEYGILSGLSSTKEPSTTFWFSTNKISRNFFMNSKTKSLDKKVLQTIHSANQPIETLDTMTTKMKNIAVTTGP